MVGTAQPVGRTGCPDVVRQDRVHPQHYSTVQDQPAARSVEELQEELDARQEAQSARLAELQDDDEATLRSPMGGGGAAVWLGARVLQLALAEARVVQTRKPAPAQCTAGWFASAHG